MRQVDWRTPGRPVQDRRRVVWFSLYVEVEDGGRVGILGIQGQSVTNLIDEVGY